MTTVLSNSSPKILKYGIFGPKFKDFYFCTKLCNNTNSRMLIWNTAIIFSNSSPKINKLDIFGTKFKDFYFVSNFSIRQIRGCWFQIWQWLFRILARKYSNKAFFVLNVSIFLILHEFRILKNSRVLIRKTATVFFKFQPKVPKYKIFSENSKVFSF